MFTDDEITAVRSTWAMVAKDPVSAARLFYGRLFETAPSVKPLFRGDMDEQGQKLMQMIAIAVNNMHDIGSIVPALETLGAKHVEYGAESAHYDVVGQVLVETLATALGDEFSDEARDAWVKTYGALAGVMKRGAAA